MNNKVLKTLEYENIIKLLEEKAGSEPAKKLCRELRPMTEIHEIEDAQRNTADALERLIKKGSISFGSNRDFGYALKSLEIGSTLTAAELLRFARFLTNVGRVKAWGVREKEEEEADSLDDYFDLLEPLKRTAEEINRCILNEDGDMADDASPTLRSIRKNKQITSDKIHSQLNQMVNGSLRTYLQDAVVTMRDNRYCIPVKAEYKGQITGMVHDQSSTGATVFIEPQAVVDLNNKIRELEIEEEKEIQVILATLSGELGVHVTELKTDMDFMTKLDFIFAKGQLALEQNATRPVFNTDHRIRIKRGRHPLLDKKKVVPIDVPLGEDYDLLVITGPNTGGKTVTLKTVGLFTLMGQAGLHIPAGDRSELSIFEEVFADIGDEQSIEQSLSTFSSHMRSIVHILENADDNSLCLFDELGAGTDPTEGAALAIAILDHLHSRGIRTMATTHYSELKLYALSTDFVQNACCEFDVETLSPTYRLLIGIPGKSNAFAISKKLGLSDTIIEAAKAQISDDSEHFEDVIADLEKSRVQMERDKEEIARQKLEILEKTKALDEKTAKLNDSKDRILREANEEARDILAEAKEYADETIRIMQKAGSNISMKDLEARRQNLRGKMNDKNEKIARKRDEKEPVGLNPKDLHIGDMVKIVSMGMKGTVSTLPDAKGNLYVQCGIIRSQTNIKDLAAVQEQEITGPGMPKSSGGSGKIKMSKALSVSYECNLIGKNVDEALAILDKYLDDAYLSHMSQVRIVHGKGTGTLRNAVQNYLKRCSYVKSYRAGEHGEGDAGVTIAEFK
ncbi:MAG: endonuclease MutS2 [Lachnospiraceae bacterium]|nr:endonuclease MutS2 [Lachnospiraceae bacterium]